MYRARGYQRLIPLLVSVALAGSLLAPPARGADTVEQGYLPFISFAPLFVGIDKGFFAELGIDLKMTRFADGSKMIAPLGRGDLDVASGSPTAGLYNAIASGLKFRIVADKGQVRKGEPGFVPLVVRKDLYDSGRVKKLADIKGLVIGQITKGAISEYSLMRMAKVAGLSFDELNQKYLSPPKQYQALKTKAIDLASTVEPWGTSSVLDGDGVILATSLEWLDRDVFQIATMMFSGKFIAERRPVAQRWVNAYVKGIQYMNKHGIASESIVPIINKWTKAGDEMIKKSIPPRFADDGSVDKPSLELSQDFYFERGLMKQKISVDEAVDMSFVRNVK